MAGYSGFYVGGTTLVMAVKNECCESRTMVVFMSFVWVCNFRLADERTNKHLYDNRNCTGDHRVVTSTKKKCREVENDISILQAAVPG